MGACDMRSGTRNIALVIVSSLLLSGCGTIWALSNNEQWPNQIYAGTRASATGHSTQLDVPFSLIADTLVLPYTIPRTIYNFSRSPDAVPGKEQAYPCKPSC